MSKIYTRPQLEEVLDNERIETVQFIHSDDECDECAMILGTRIFSSHYVMPKELVKFAVVLLSTRKVLMFEFSDKELTNAWKKSYEDGGISKDRWDRRTVFHPYSEMNEMFCIDNLMLEEIKGENAEFYELPSWKVGVVNWYRDNILYNQFCEQLGFEWGKTYVPHSTEN